MYMHILSSLQIYAHSPAACHVCASDDQPAVLIYRQCPLTPSSGETELGGQSVALSMLSARDHLVIMYTKLLYLYLALFFDCSKSAFES